MEASSFEKKPKPYQIVTEESSDEPIIIEESKSRLD